MGPLSLDKEEEEEMWLAGWPINQKNDSGRVFLLPPLSPKTQLQQELRLEEEEEEEEQQADTPILGQSRHSPYPSNNSCGGGSPEAGGSQEDPQQQPPFSK